MDIIHVWATKGNKPFLLQFLRYVDVEVYFTEYPEQLKFISFQSYAHILTCNDMVCGKLTTFEESVFHSELFSSVVKKILRRTDWQHSCQTTCTCLICQSKKMRKRLVLRNAPKMVKTRCGPKLKWHPIAQGSTKKKLFFQE